VTVNAQELVASVRSQLLPVRKRVRDHPYLKAVDDGRVDLGQLRPFVGEQFLIISSDLRSMAQLVSRYEGDFFLDLLAGERAALSTLPQLATAFAMGADDLLDYEPLAGGQAYTAYVAWLAVYATDAEVAAALAVNYQGWSESHDRMGRALRTQYSLSGEQAAFFELFAETHEEFEGRALQVVDAGLQQGVPERLLRRSPRLLLDYELLFWDTLYETLSPASAPLPVAGDEGDLGE
jgi:pyrroloquinoline quinone (PQQ) biosynthesis protein C